MIDSEVRDMPNQLDYPGMNGRDIIRSSTIDLVSIFLTGMTAGVALMAIIMKILGKL